MGKYIALSKIPLGNLKNEEFFQVCDQTVVAISRNNAEALKIEKVVNLLKECLVTAREKTEPYQVHPLSPAIVALSTHIDDVVIALLSINRGHKRAVPIDLKVSAELTVPFIENSLTGFSAQNNLVKSEWLKSLFEKMDSNSALNLALIAMNQKPLLEDLRQAHTELVDKKNQRTREKLPPITESSLAQIQQAKCVLRNLFTTIETNALVEKELDYEPLIANINAIQAEVMAHP